MADVRTDEDELDELRAISRTRWNRFEWEYVGAYDDDPLVRCSVIVPPERAGKVKVDSGEELPASWHQQANGGFRYWTTAAGEFEAK